MRSSFRGTLISFLLFIVVSTFSHGAVAANARTVLVLGDSLSSAHGIDTNSGWVTLLQQRLDKQQTGYKVVNASVSGDTTANGLNRLPPLLTSHSPDIVIVALGGNDGLRGLPTDRMKGNLNSIAARARSAGSKVLLVGVRIPPNYGKRYTEMFQKVYRDVAMKQRIPLVPLILDGVDLDQAQLQSDRIHPGAKAQARILDNIWPVLQPMLQK